MSNLPISVFIITKNEEDRIASAIKGVKSFADEILVIDSGSTDKTIQIAEKLGAKTIHNDWKGYGQQKIFGENLCKNDWILNIDADEEVSEELAQEIRQIFSAQHQNEYPGYKVKNEYPGYKVKIVNKFFNEAKPKKLAYFYNQLRLYNKKLAGFKNSAIHDSVELRNSKAKIGQLQNIIYHQSLRSYQHWVEKINSYSDMQALDSFKKNKNPGILKIAITPGFAFLKAYIIRRYFIYGFNGLIYSYIFAFGRTIKLIKTRNLFSHNKK